MKRRKRAVALIGFVALVAVLGFACWRGWGAGGIGASADALEDTVELRVDVACEGWSPANTALGVFVSGARFDGAPCDEQLVFEGSGRQAAYLGAGSYEIVPQLPMLLLSDGTVLAASEPISKSYADDAPAADGVEVVYGPMDAGALTEDELRGVAECSFANERDAAAALERAMAQRGEGGSDE